MLIRSLTLSAVFAWSAATRPDFIIEQDAPTLEYRVTGSGDAVTAYLHYTSCTGESSSNSGARLPWSLTCTNKIPAGQFQLSAVLGFDNRGCVKVAVYVNWELLKDAEACGPLGQAIVTFPMR